MKGRYSKLCRPDRQARRLQARVQAEPVEDTPCSQPSRQEAPPTLHAEREEEETTSTPHRSRGVGEASPVGLLPDL